MNSVSHRFVNCLRPVLVLVVVTSTAAAADAPLFEDQVYGLLKTYCWKCHGGEARQAGLDMRSQPQLLVGGKHGPAIVPGDAEASLLYRKLAAGDMPPGNELKPTAAHRETIRAWIDAGAAARYTRRRLSNDEDPVADDEDRAWWAFVPPVRPPLPAVEAADRVGTPIDSLVIARLEAAGLGLAPPADRRTLVRRAYLDLLGLPPTPREVEAFLADTAADTAANTAPGAWSRLVDRLLASPHYGERWGRHWLDAAGYVDTRGSDNDATIIKPSVGIWQYRDYCIDAFNTDKPFDQFLVEQLAGDELVDWREVEDYSPAVLEKLVATGFLRLARDVTYAPELNTADIRHQVIYDTIQTIASGVMGLTIHCARCHTHKFDPIAQADYFRLMAIFTPSYDVQNWVNSDNRHLYTVSAKRKQQIDTRNTDVNRQVDQRTKQVDAVRNRVSGRLRQAKLATLPDPVRADTDAALKVAKDKRTAVQKYLAGKLGPLLAVSGGEIDKGLAAAERGEIDGHRAEIGRLNNSRQRYEQVQALWDHGAPPPAYLYRRGDYTTPGSRVKPGVPAVLSTSGPPTRFEDPGPGARSSGYRLAFARWLTAADHPLTARVVVNRMWQRYFGRGIVATPGNFGQSGAEPTHPLLLDWLARELVESGWSMKHMHRLILHSAVYRQSTSRREAEWERATRVDPDNRLLWRMPLRRLESEVIRDSVLAVSGTLDRYPGGPAVPLKSNADSSVEIDTKKQRRPTDHLRRSLYLLCRRNYQLTELIVFDQPTVAHNCIRRDSSAVVLQSLAMLNGRFVMEQSRHFATRVRSEAGPDPARRITRAFELALGRLPTPEELQLTTRFLARQPENSIDHLCHMLLNTNEFLYVP